MLPAEKKKTSEPELPTTKEESDIQKFQVEVRDIGRCICQVTFRRLKGCPLTHGKVYRNILKQINENYPKLVFVS